MSCSRSYIEHPVFTATMALVQATILHFLYLAIENNWNITQTPEYLYSFTGFTVSFPFVLLFIRRNANAGRVIILSLATAIVITLCAYYTGIQSKPVDKVVAYTIFSVYIFCSLIIVFKAVIYSQLHLSNQAYSFANLYKNSWRTFIVALEAAIFSCLLFAILYLGAELFDVIGIFLFSDLLVKSYIVIPIFTLSFSFAVNYFQTSEKVADTIAMVVQTIIKFILPVVALILIGFAISIIFTGVGTLWEKGPGSTLILWLQALALFFVNSVYMGTKKTLPYKSSLHNLTMLGIAFLPLYSILASYGLWLRVDQYGLTPSRGFGILVNLLISAFSFSYLAAIITAKTKWFLIKNRINQILGISVVLVCILLNSPILSMQKLSTNSQITKLIEKQLVLDADLWFFKRNLGSHGYLALQGVKEKMLLTDISFEKRLNEIFSKSNFYSAAHHEAKTNAGQFEYKTIPENTKIPKVIIEKTFSDNSYRMEKIFIQLDINNDSVKDYIVITNNNYNHNHHLWLLVNDKWVSRPITLKSPTDSVEIDQLFVDPNSITIDIEKPKFNHVRLGNSIIFVSPSVSN